MLHCRAHQAGKKDQTGTGELFSRQGCQRGCRKRHMRKQIFIPLPEIPLPAEKPEYSARHCQLIETLEVKFDPRGWAVSPTRQIIVPEPILHEIVDCEHKATNWRAEKLLKHLQ